MLPLILAFLVIGLTGCVAVGPPAEKVSHKDTVGEDPITKTTNAEPLIPGLESLDACPWEADDLAQTMLTLLNQTRSQARMCGDSDLEAAPPLSLNQQLGLAAARHSADMANNNFFRHEGSDGQKAGNRTDAAGYQWSSVAENIAGGQTDMVTVIQDWLASEKHCLNLMRPELTEAGIACSKRDDTDLKLYWTLVLARPLLE
ncbi:MAG: CAP domain-containing protein [Granulosicoccus sp.]|nr:CAP domain-containing protein [Granulosicoccus sp.]